MNFSFNLERPPFISSFSSLPPLSDHLETSIACLLGWGSPRWEISFTDLLEEGSICVVELRTGNVAHPSLLIQISLQELGCGRSKAI